MANNVSESSGGGSANLDSKKGGKARAESLSTLERKAIAQNAANSRWQKQKQVAEKATHMGILKIGDLELACAVLGDGRRVISERGLLAALGIQVGGTLSAARKNEN